MFAIALQQQQYKTYILSDNASRAQLEVVPERGGIITRWRVQGQEMLYLDAERFTHPDLSVRGGVPILFPICGNLPDNTYTHNGQQYTLKQHGFARELPWEVTDQVTKDQASLTVVLKSNEQTKAVYPFDFQLAFTYELQGNTLEIRQEYQNLSSTPMPFSAGFHPYFAVGDKTQLEFEIPSGQYLDQQTKEVHPFNGNFDFSRDEMDFAFGQLTGQSAAVVDHRRKLKLTLDYDEIYPWLVFWTLKGKEFYCLEPWTAPRNSLNTGENLTVLAPGASCTASVRLTANLFSAP
ncbi:galactose mutarotase-like enzyme [Cylindrospermum stagnale PCC 7417]|uniref:Galactose mutarotase-like enzyme n=1 Tax=Cylindrospermum stagnale PCC 7417 TaxID=56107 RepID=K9WS89_9NOST|nr:galactose mutarotase-like enzyme [Cylindrospermum stagnale]AFZ22422.1 galactose mutarotase-like enzyme [Cylindrospermum stagnale PCC 7417]